MRFLRDHFIGIGPIFLGFIVAMLVNTYLLETVPEVGKAISGLARNVLKAVGIKPLLQGYCLGWLSALLR